MRYYELRHSIDMHILRCRRAARYEARHFRYYYARIIADISRQRRWACSKLLRAPNINRSRRYHDGPRFLLPQRHAIIISRHMSAMPLDCRDDASVELYYATLQTCRDDRR